MRCALGARRYSVRAGLVLFYIEISNEKKVVTVTGLIT
jgi:hypothetical protein